MDVILTFTKANIQKGWQNSSCPVHRAVARAFSVPTENTIASLNGIGYYDKDNRYHLVKVDDFQYLCKVMSYADHLVGFNEDTPALPPARKIVVHVDN